MQSNGYLIRKKGKPNGYKEKGGKEKKARKKYYLGSKENLNSLVRKSGLIVLAVLAT